MTPPRHLWAGPWREESDKARAQQPEPLPAPAPDQPDGPATEPAPAAAPRDGSRLHPRIVALLAPPVVLLAVRAAVLGSAFGHHGSSHKTASTTKPAAALPAVSAVPIKPRTGQTRAGAIYAKASPAVVSIRTGSGSGTGFLVDNAQTVVTNAHVVDA